jgi:membrane-bound inhibitor of C-type lysozyme
VGEADAQARGPAFDCAKATGEVEKLVCTDEGLAALDRKLDGVYNAALAKARDDVPRFLRTELRLVPPKGPVFFAYNNQSSNVFTATFFETDPPTASVERGDRTVIAYQVRTASGARYEGQNVALLTKDNEATITWLGEELKCKLSN